MDILLVKLEQIGSIGQVLGAIIALSGFGLALYGTVSHQPDIADTGRNYLLVGLAVLVPTKAVALPPAAKPNVTVVTPPAK